MNSLLRSNEKDRQKRNFAQEASHIIQSIKAIRRHAMEKPFLCKPLRELIYPLYLQTYSKALTGIDMPRHVPPDGNGDMDYVSVLNDHLAGGSHLEAPCNKLASDHGQIMAHLRLQGGDDEEL